MQIKIEFNKEELESHMKENGWKIYNLSYFWGVSTKVVKKMFEDDIIFDSKFVSKITMIEYDLVVFENKEKE